MDPTTNMTYRTWQPFGPGYVRLVNVAQGDVNGDGYDDIIVSTNGAARGRVKVYDGKLAVTLPASVDFNDTVTNPAVLLGVITPFAPGLNSSANTYLGGITVASGDVNGDGVEDIICGTAASTGTVGQLVVVSGLSFLTQLGTTLQPFGPNFVGGVQVAAGDLGGDGFAEVIVGTTSNKSRVKGFSLVGNNFFQSLATMAPFADGPNGVRLATLDVTGDGKMELAVGNLDATGGVTVKIFGASGAQQFVFPATDKAANYAIAGLDGNGDGIDDLMIGTVPLSGFSGGVTQVDILNPISGLSVGGFDAFAVLTGNVSLAGV